MLQGQRHSADIQLNSAVNFTYPWRDNFGELRRLPGRACPGGYGHQGQDMRAGNCVLNNEGADRCLPYQHTSPPCAMA